MQEGILKRASSYASKSPYIAFQLPEGFINVAKALRVLGLDVKVSPKNTSLDEQRWSAAVEGRVLVQLAPIGKNISYKQVSERRVASLLSTQKANVLRFQTNELGAGTWDEPVQSPNVLAKVLNLCADTSTRDSTNSTSILIEIKLPSHAIYINLSRGLQSNASSSAKSPSYYTELESTLVTASQVALLMDCFPVLHNPIASKAGDLTAGLFSRCVNCNSTNVNWGQTAQTEA
jgi:hypothetical protein